MKKNVALIIILIICLIGTSSYIVYDKFGKKENEVTQNEVQKNTEKKDSNENNVVNNGSKEIEERISDISGAKGLLSYINSEDRGNNVLESDINRINYIKYSLKEDTDYILTIDSDTDEGTFKASNKTFSEKYSKTFCSKYDFSQDMENIGTTQIWSCDDNRNICWTGDNVKGTEISMTLVSTNLSDNIYTLTGTYNLSEHESNETYETGSFEIKYSINNNVEKLESIIFTKK